MDVGREAALARARAVQVGVVLALARVVPVRAVLLVQLHPLAVQLELHDERVWAHEGGDLRQRLAGGQHGLERGKQLHLLVHVRGTCGGIRAR